MSELNQISLWSGVLRPPLLPPHCPAETEAARDGNGNGRANVFLAFGILSRRKSSLQEISSSYQTGIDLEKKFAIKSNAGMQEYLALLLPDCVASLPSHPTNTAAAAI